MKKMLKYSGILVVIIIVIILRMYLNNDIGVYKVNLERDARSAHKIPNDWQVAKDTTESMSAMIFYDETFKDHTFSIYINRTGLSNGYFFRGGGSTGATTVGIAEFYIEGYVERAFISMNEQQVCKIEIDNGNSIRTIEIDSTKPFAFILPVNTGSVTFYDINGNIVEYQQERL